MKGKMCHEGEDVPVKEDVPMKRKMWPWRGWCAHEEEDVPAVGPADGQCQNTTARALWASSLCLVNIFFTLGQLIGGACWIQNRLQYICIPTSLLPWVFACNGLDNGCKRLQPQDGVTSAGSLHAQTPAFATSATCSQVSPMHFVGTKIYWPRSPCPWRAVLAALHPDGVGTRCPTTSWQTPWRIYTPSRQVLEGTETSPIAQRRSTRSRLLSKFGEAWSHRKLWHPLFWAARGWRLEVFFIKVGLMVVAVWLFYDMLAVFWTETQDNVCYLPTRPSTKQPLTVRLFDACFGNIHCGRSISCVCKSARNVTNPTRPTPHPSPHV